MQKRYIFVFIIFFFFFLTLPVLAQGLQCDFCGTSITYSNLGKKTRNGYLCKDCYRNQQERQQMWTQQQEQQTQTQQQTNLKQCDSCGTSITYRNLGKRTRIGYLCKSCYRQQKKLQQQEEEQKQQRAESKKQWLQSKQQDKSKQQQIKQKEQKKSQNKVCTFCNKPLEAGKKYYLIHDEPFCSTCYKTFKERCKTCGYLIPPGEEVRNGSWIVCTACSKDIITTDSQLKACYAEACAFMKSYFGLNAHVTPDRVYFSDMSEMDGACGLFIGGGKTIDCSTKKILSLHLDRSTIKLQKGMSKLGSIKALVHEVGHSCMYQFGYEQESSSMYKEGFAEWCAYKYVMSIGKTWRGTEKRDYAEGLRKMLELEKKMKGEDGLLEYVKTHNDFPKE